MYVFSGMHQRTLDAPLFPIINDPNFDHLVKTESTQIYHYIGNQILHEPIHPAIIFLIFKFSQTWIIERYSNKFLCSFSHGLH